MLAEYKRNTNVGVGIGLLVQIAGQILTRSGDPMRTLAGIVLLLIGCIVFIWGCSQYARGKGLSPWFGGLGLFSIVGLIVLVLLPDQHKDANA